MTGLPISTIYLPGFDQYTRASYFQKFGKPAPPADPTKRPKSWIGSGTFHFVMDASSLVEQTIPDSEKDVNLDGAGPFLSYVIAPTKASVDGLGGQPYNAGYLSLEADARALMQAVGGNTLTDEGVNPFLPLFYPADEPRREWEFLTASGIKVNAGVLLATRNQQGVGSPGKWDASEPTPVWVPSHPVTSPIGPWSQPCRALAANEHIGPGDLGLATLFVDDGTSTGDTGGSGYTQADRDRDNQILALLKRIATERLGLTL